MNLVTWSKEMMHDKAWQEIQEQETGTHLDWKKWLTIKIEENSGTLNIILNDKSAMDLSIFCLEDAQAKNSIE